MMKIYKGIRLNPEQGTISNVVVTVNSEPLKHHIRHSPDGFNWGYGGSGPADLALNILWDFIGAEPTPDLYQKFKSDFVSGWGNVWAVNGNQIQDWLDKISGPKLTTSDN
jgi:hypothetical protein